jgi:hypothetical protein
MVSPRATPHLTIGNGAAPEQLQAAASAVAPSLPIGAVADRVWLMKVLLEFVLLDVHGKAPKGPVHPDRSHSVGPRWPWSRCVFSSSRGSSHPWLCRRLGTRSRPTLRADYLG